MHVNELLDALPIAEPAPVYLFTAGKAHARARETTFEPFMAEHAVQQLIDAYVDPANRDFAFGMFYADETAPEDVVGEAQTLPFLAERRVIVVRNADAYQFESRGAAVTAYLEDPCESTVLILIASKLDKRTRFYKTCGKAGEVVECPMLNPKEAAGWLKREADRRGVQIDAAAVRELLARAGAHLSDINNALNLVVNFVGDESPRISEEDVVAACADVAEEEVWTLTDAIAASDSATAVRALRNLLELGKHPDEIIGTINWMLKSAYQVANPDSSANLSRFVANKVTPLAQKLGRRKLEDALALCTDTQFMMRETGVDAPVALDLLVVKLAMPRKQPA